MFDSDLAVEVALDLVKGVQEKAGVAYEEATRLIDVKYPDLLDDISLLCAIGHADSVDDYVDEVV